MERIFVIELRRSLKICLRVKRVRRTAVPNLTKKHLSRILRIRF
jgi:hypothetical protein